MVNGPQGLPQTGSLADHLESAPSQPKLWFCPPYAYFTIMATRESPQTEVLAVEESTTASLLAKIAVSPSLYILHNLWSTVTVQKTRALAGEEITRTSQSK